MEIKSTSYPVFLNTRVATIPQKDILELIEEFAINAKFYMSSDIDTETTDKINSAVIDLLKGRFKHLPLNLVAEAYTKGSLGELGGTTRFTVRNIYTWLSAIEEKSRRLKQEEQSKVDDERRKNDEKVFLETKRRNNMFGAAMYRKIEWCHAGLLNSQQYDLCTLDKIVALVEKGYKIDQIEPMMIL